DRATDPSRRVDLVEMTERADAICRRPRVAFPYRAQPAGHRIAICQAIPLCIGTTGNESGFGARFDALAGHCLSDRTSSAERAAHGRRTEPQPLRGAHDAAFCEQAIERDQLVEIGCGHALTIAQRRHGVKRTDRVHPARLPPCGIARYACAITSRKRRSLMSK